MRTYKKIIPAVFMIILTYGCSSWFVNEDQVTFDEIIKMSKEGVGDEVIKSYINETKSRFKIKTEDIKMLREEGVSDDVIDYIIRSKDAVYSSKRPPWYSAYNRYYYDRYYNDYVYAPWHPLDLWNNSYDPYNYRRIKPFYDDYWGLSYDPFQYSDFNAYLQNRSLPNYNRPNGMLGQFWKFDDYSPYYTPYGYLNNEEYFYRYRAYRKYMRDLYRER